VPCALGAVLIVKGENYYRDLCGISWHLMPISNQKSIQMIMSFSVKPRQLSAGFKILNMETFVDVKFIYK
jgi:hypothetical protein